MVVMMMMVVAMATVIATAVMAALILMLMELFTAPMPTLRQAMPRSTRGKRCQGQHEEEQQLLN